VNRSGLNFRAHCQGLLLLALLGGLVFAAGAKTIVTEKPFALTDRASARSSTA
jgi:hypothetical protein